MSVLDTIASRLAQAGEVAPDIVPSGAGAARALYRDGLISLGELAQELRTLGYGGLRLGREVHIAGLERRRKAGLDALEALGLDLRRGTITKDAYITSAAGLVPTAVHAGVLADRELRRRASPPDRPTAVGLRLDAPPGTAAVVPPSAAVPLLIALVDLATAKEISGAIVQLQLYDQAIGDFRTVATAQTGPGGTAAVRWTAPAQPGRYRLRAAWPGSLDLRPDRSPELPLTVARP